MAKRNKDKGKNNDLQNITHKTKDRVTGTLLKTRAELQKLRKSSSSCSTNNTHRATLVTNLVILTATQYFTIRYYIY